MQIVVHQSVNGICKTLLSNKLCFEEVLVNLSITSLNMFQVFLKYYHIELLARKSEDFLRKVTRIQAVFRMILTRNRYYELKWRREKAVIQMQRCKTYRH